MSKTLSIELKTDPSHAFGPNNESNLQYGLKIMAQLSRWLVKTGIGHQEFSEAMRTLFYNAALEELEHSDQKKTDSALSLLSGLNRREVRQLREISGGEYRYLENHLQPTKINVPARVVALWVHLGLPSIIPTCGREASFEYLVKKISTEKHPRSILAELIRLKLVVETGPNVFLQTQSFTPDPDQQVTRQILSDNVADHLAAGIHNLNEQNDFLEQAVFADELTQESIQYLKEKTNLLWSQCAKQLLAEAIQCCQKDQGKPQALYRFRAGMYQYDAKETHKICK